VSRAGHGSVRVGFSPFEPPDPCLSGLENSYLLCSLKALNPPGIRVGRGGLCGGGLVEFVGRVEYFYSHCFNHQEFKFPVFL
jgi:hypothetical protein